MARRGSTLELAVLGLLLESPLHGYELRKRLNLILGWSRLLSYGSLYPALKKMLRAGLISDDTVAVGRRQKIVYAITDAGRDRFAEEVSDGGPDTWEDDVFELRLTLFSRTDAAVRLRILEGRRARLQERLDRMQSAAKVSGDTWVSELRAHTIDSVERELGWLGGLIEAERPRPADPAESPRGSQRSITTADEESASISGGDQ